MNGEMRVLGVVCARGGSKRLPRKNVMLLAGKPMVAWSVEAAKGSKLDWCMVSTDDWQIRDAAERVGGWVPYMRPKYLAGDKARIVDAVAHAVLWCEKRGVTPTHVMLLQASSPMRTSQHIDKAIGMLGREIERNGRAPRSLVTRTRQRMNNGCIYLCERDMVVNDRILWEDTSVVMEQGPRMVDVDCIEDFQRAGLLLHAREKGKGRFRREKRLGEEEVSCPHPISSLRRISS